MTTTSPSATQIVAAMRDLIAFRAAVPIPLTTLNGASSSHALSLTIHPCLDDQGRSRFLPGGKVGILDGGRDVRVPIADVSSDGATLTLSAAAMGSAGLLDAHADGATVYTNLLAYAPWSIAPMLALGSDPVVFVTSRGWRTRHDGQRYTYPIHRIQVQIHRQYDRPDGSALDPDVWAGDQEEAMRAELKGLEDMLLTHQQLAGPYNTPLAVQFGALGGASDMSETTIDQKPVSGDTWQIIGAQVYTITANAGSTGG